MTITQHNLLIGELLLSDKDLHCRGFRKTVREQLCSEGDDDNYFPWEEVADVLTFVPDAFKIVGRELRCFEIVDTSDVRMAKQDKYARAFNALDAWDRTLRLWVYHMDGLSSEQNLDAWFLDWARRCRPMGDADD